MRRILPNVRFVCVMAVLAAVGCDKKTLVGPDPIVPDPPRITCPAPPAQTSTTGQGMVVTFTPTVSDGAAPVTTTCTPASGSMFAIGTTPVSCIATDARQRSSSCAFNVVIQTPPRLSLTRFIAFGDSITWGEDGNTTLRFALENPLNLSYPRFVLVGREYPTVLQNLLTDRYRAQQITVENRGVPAERAGAPQTLADFVRLVSSRSFDVVLLMEGTNDIYAEGGGNAAGIPPAIANLRRMIGEARSRGVRVLLATVPPQNPAGFRGARGYLVVPELNREIRLLARGEGVPLVDVFDAFNGDFTKLSGDGLHPNADGFALIARAFFDVIRQSLETTTTLTGARGAGALPEFGPAVSWAR